MTAVLADRGTERPNRVRPRVRRALLRPAPQPTPATPTPAQPRQVDSVATAISTSFTMLTIVCLWMAAQLLFLGGLSQHRDQSLLYAELRTQLASATAPLGPVVPVGDPVAVLAIPSIGLDQVVVEGTASGDTLAGPGHRRDTPLPGQAGTSVVYGRAATYGAPFADLADLEPGDKVKVTMAQGRSTFTVLGVRRAGDPLPQPAAEGHARLTLVTAEGEGRLGAISPTDVIYVDAESTKARPAPPGRPAAVPSAETAMQVDRSAMPLLALHLALLLALTLGVIAARQRWSGLLVWVVACPPVLALSWATTDVVMRLLPNVI